MSRVDLDLPSVEAFLAGPKVTAELRRRTLKVERRAKTLAPVDTGRLRSSIESEVTTDAEGPVGIVGTDVDYAIYVELGTSRMSAQPFLRPALDAAKGNAR